MDDWSDNTKFSGLSAHSTYNNDRIKVIKLDNYRRAISNFVKILTKTEIPVLWYGSTSHTDGKSITLSTDIKDNNFDVATGLALHEASHIILSNFSLLQNLADTEKAKILYGIEDSLDRTMVKDILNWIEDRRIDNFVFSTSPGYKAYYHKLYDYYFFDSKLTSILKSKAAAQPTRDNYILQLFNMMHPAFNKHTLPGMDEIVSLIDLPHINRLKSTEDCLSVALAVLAIIKAQVAAAKSNAAAWSQQQQSQHKANDVKLEQNDPQGTEQTADQVLQSQRNFVNNKTAKATAKTKKLARQLDHASQTNNAELQEVGKEKFAQTALIVHLTNPSIVGPVIADFYEAFNDQKDWTKRRAVQKKFYEKHDDTLGGLNVDFYQSIKNTKHVDEGINLGALLGQKLQLHSETRERVDNRLQYGTIDNRRLAHAGYDIQTIFKQIHLQQYKKANIHISLDMSGSMSECDNSKWLNTIKMTAAIAKAVSYTKTVNLQVSLRGGNKEEGPVLHMIYDSRKSKLADLFSLLKMTSPNGLTPEGLLFEAMIRKNMLVPGSRELNSYFINISDGEPSFKGYGSHEGVYHTKSMVQQMEAKLQIKVLGYFIKSSYDQHSEPLYGAANILNHYYGYNNRSAINFCQMYGKSSAMIPANSVPAIAKSMNQMLLTKVSN